MSTLQAGRGYVIDPILSDLQTIRQQGLYRSPRIINERNGAEIIIDGKALVNFSSNDYLGLAGHGEIKQAINEAALKHGSGSSASPLVSGKTSLHRELENKLARVTGRERALIFSCGYMANLGLIQGLIHAHRYTIFMDKLCHASIIDGAVLSRAKFKRYTHASVESLSTLLKDADIGEKLVLTESVFSMDGDVAPLVQISQVCRDSRSCLVVDDAHGFGVLGEKGMGALDHFHLSQDDVPLMMATFGKALGGQGAFVAGKEELIDILIQRARPYIYSTSMPVHNVAAAITSLDILQAEPKRRQSLKNIITYFKERSGFLGDKTYQNISPIQPIIIGDSDKTMKLCALMEQQGIFVTGIRPPTVPRNTSRLRITLTALHTTTQVDHLLEVLKGALAQL